MPSVIGRAVLDSIGGPMAGLRGIEIDREIRGSSVGAARLNQGRYLA
jgi:hypothetical protein